MKNLLLSLVTLTAFAWTPVAHAQQEAATGGSQCLRLGADETLAETYASFEKLINAIYAHAGLCATSVAMTPKRIEQQMLSGEIDGDWFRPSEYIATRNLGSQVVPQALFGMEARMIWLKGTPFSGDPQELKGLTVGYTAGFRWLETHIPLMGGKPFSIYNIESIPALLERRRIDVYATSSVHEPHILMAFGDKVDMLNRAHWATEPFYHVLLARHADKIPALNAAVRDMIASGEIKAYLTAPGIVAVPLHATTF